jgi:hypothetical protein
MATPPPESASAFGARLDAAILANSFSTEDVQTYLARRGRSVTSESIDSWRAGDSLPDLPGTVSTLEEVLRIAPGFLESVIITPAAVRGSAPTAPALSNSERLKQSLHPDALTWSKTLHLESDVTLGPGHFITEVRVRITEEVLVDGVDKFLVVTYGEESENLVGLRLVPLQNCRRGRIRLDPEESLICIELLLDHSHLAGETFTLEYVWVFDRPSLDSEFWNSSRNHIPFGLIRIHFTKSELPARCYEFTSRTPRDRSRSREIRLHGTQAHSVVTNFPGGEHGIFWEWE